VALVVNGSTRKGPAKGFLQRAKHWGDGFLTQAEAVRSDFRDSGPVLAALLDRAFTARIVDLTLVDYADVLATPQPTSVAAALAVLY
jgi:hypothetical protein